MMTTELENVPEIPLFSGFSEGEMQCVLEAAEVREYETGDWVLEQGDTSQNLWIVLEGSCEVVRWLGERQSQSSVVLAHLKPSDVFGEMSFFHQAPHSAGVKASGPLKLMCLTRASCNAMLENGSLVFYKLSFNTVDTLAHRLRRMDDWVAELHKDKHVHSPSPEWDDFRSKLFADWRQV